LNNNISVSTMPVTAAKQEEKIEVVIEDFRVTGTVTSGDGSGAMPGVTILVKGTSIGATTDASGKYTIEAPDGNAVLVFSFIGYLTEEVPIESRSVIDLVMMPDITTLEEIVVIGYGTAKKSDLTGSVASVSGEDLKKMPVSTVAETLTGRMAGVQITSTEGSPDAEIRIRVRGGGS